MPNQPFFYETVGPIEYATRGKAALLSPPSGKNLAVGEVILTNMSGSAVDVGWGMLMPTATWKAGQIDASETPDYIDDTTDAQDAGADDFVLFTTTNNDGFMIQCTEKFNLVGITVGVAQVGSPTIAYQYFNGTSMTALPRIYSTPVYTSTGDIMLAFPTPPDWAKGTTAAVGGDSAYYCLQVIATTAPATTGGTATVAWLGKLFDFYPSLANNSVLNTEMKGEMVITHGAGFLPYFGAAHANNTVQVHYRPY